MRHIVYHYQRWIQWSSIKSGESQETDYEWSKLVHWFLMFWYIFVLSMSQVSQCGYHRKWTVEGRFNMDSTEQLLTQNVFYGHKLMHWSAHTYNSCAALNPVTVKQDSSMDAASNYIDYVKSPGSINTERTLWYYLTKKLKTFVLAFKSYTARNDSRLTKLKHSSHLLWYYQTFTQQLAENLIKDFMNTHLNAPTVLIKRTM